MFRWFSKNRLFVGVRKAIALVLVLLFVFTDLAQLPLANLFLTKSTVPTAEASVTPAIRVESFDQDVTTDGSTFTLTNDVGDVNSAFIRMSGGTRKTSAGPTGSTANTAPNVGTVGLVLTGTNEVTVERADPTAVKVMGEVWRYEGSPGAGNEFIVRDRVSVSLTGATQSTPISGISDVDKVVPFVTGYTVNAATVNDWEDASIAAHMDDFGNLVVSRNNSGTAATVYVDVVEFTGSQWTVCHGFSGAHDGIEETVTLNTDSDGQGGATCDVGDWSTATIIEATMEGDSSETGLSDTLALVRPGANTTSVVFDLMQDGNAANDGDAWIHVLQNDDMAVSRTSNADIAEGNGSYDFATWPSGATTTASFSTLGLEWFTDTSGVGTAHMRGGLHARIVGERTYNDGDLVADIDYDSTLEGNYEGDITFPASPSGVIYEAGGTGTGAFVGYNDAGDFIVRAGNGGSTAPADAARLVITTSDYDFSSRTGTLAWNFFPGTESVSLSFDEGSNGSIEYSTSTVAAAAWADWSGGDDGFVGNASASIAGSEITSGFDFNGTITQVRFRQGAPLIEHWIHRSGNNVGVEYGVIELAGLASVTETTIVSAVGTQTASSSIPQTDVVLGGAFVITENTASRNVSNITITESGSVDGANDLDNLKLFYDLDTSAPYDCASESYGGGESQFGSTDTNGFSGPDGVSSFADTVSISPTQTMCVYSVYDVLETASDGDTVEIAINDPTNDITVSGGGSISPPLPIAIAGATTLQNAELTQIHYHWRNDDGSETTASSIDGAEDTPASGFSFNSIRRLRLAVSNEGSVAAAEARFRLEYAEKTTTCSAATGWTDVESAVDWEMAGNSPNIADGDTTNISGAAFGEVTDEATTFVGTGALRESTSLSASTTLAFDEFIELEYALSPTNGAPEGTTYCFRVTDNGSELRNYSIYPEGTVSADVTVASIGNQISSIDAGATNQHIGGAFTVARDGGSRDLTSVTITETGTVDAANDLSNIVLRYEVDTAAPFNCSTLTFDGDEAQYGATSTSFSAANGSTTFTQTLGIQNNEAVCLYVLFDVASEVTNGETIDIQIAAPATDVVVTSSSVSPTSAISLTGSTTVAGPILSQVGYHWRNDDDVEADATSATAGVENTTLSAVARNTPYRLRLLVDNEGSVASQPAQYQLEYATKISTCALAGSWQAIDVGSAFAMEATSQLVDNADTTDIAAGIGGITNPLGQSLLSPNGGQQEIDDSTGNVTLSASQFVELEYALYATDQSGYDTDYCFRVSDNGTPLLNYTSYPELTTREKQDFFVQRGTTAVSGTSVTLTAGTDYTAPANASSAFVRITNSQLTGAGPNSNGTVNAANATVYISDQTDLTTDFTFTRPAGATGDTRVEWEIVEYIGLVGADNEIIVHDTGTITYGTSALTATGSAAVGVADDSDVVVYITGQLNPAADTTSYSASLSTAAWNAATAEPVFTRGQTNSVAAGASYAVVEFTGLNWKVQRAEHNYTGVGTETEAVTAVSSRARTFIHPQKRVEAPDAGLDEHGAEVWLSSLGALSLSLNSGADTPTAHYSVVWLIENTQVGTGAMLVYRDDGTLASAGSVVQSTIIPLPATINNLSNASLISVSNESTGSGTAYPRPILAARIASSTDYELWRSDAGQSQTYRMEFVLWPVAQLAFEQNFYQLYVDNDSLTPTDPWPAGVPDLGENMSLTSVDDPLGEGERIRLRMSVQVNNASLPAATKSFKLQYGRRTGESCSAISTWTDVDVPGGAGVWRGYDATPVDGDELPSTILSVSDIAGTYEEENTTAINPNAADVDQDIEFDWMVEHNGATQRADYCFRMVESDDTVFAGYANYPTVRTTGYTPLITNWRWYDDAASITPTSSLESENVTPTDIQINDVVKLRATLTEVESAPGANLKFSLEYSQFPDFSDGGTLVTASSSCLANSIWCYADGGGVNDALIDAGVLTDSDSCTGGTGAGCGTHNETATSSNSALAHPALGAIEMEFTLRQAGARVNGVYYFRLRDTTTDEPVAASSTFPSVLTGASTLSSETSGVNPGATVEGFTVNATSTPTGVTFGSVPFGTQYIAAQQFTFDTNSTQGYQVLVFADQDLTNGYGGIIPPVSTSNAAPGSWVSACTDVTIGCFGYHSGDDVLEGGSTRFAPQDSFAAFTTTPAEAFYTSVPGNDIFAMIYAMQIGNQLPAGDYEANITYIVVPVF